MALHAADKNDERDAIRLFRDGLKKGNEETRRRCAEALTRLGNMKERVEASDYLVSQWTDDAALLVACTELDKDNESSRVILYTSQIDILTAPNELVALRLKAMLKKNDSRFEDYLYTWIMNRPLSSEHLELYERYLNREAESSKKNRWTKMRWRHHHSPFPRTAP